MRMQTLSILQRRVMDGCDTCPRIWRTEEMEPNGFPWPPADPAVIVSSRRGLDDRQFTTLGFSFGQRVP